MGRNTIPITESTVYNTTTGLYAGVRGLQNNSGSTFRIDRFAYDFVTPSAPLPGDYNGDEVVNAIDYTVWRDTEGQTGAGLAADSDNSGVVDIVDYTTWLSNYGLSLPAISTATHPIIGAAAPVESESVAAQAIYLQPVGT